MPVHNRFRPLEPLVPARIREARMARGMTINELAEAIGITRQAISRIELGTMPPSSSTVEALSFALKVPSAFFRKALDAPLSRSTTFYRSLKTNAARAKEIMATKSEWVSILANTLADDVIFPEPDLPSIPTEIDATDCYSAENIEAIAAHVREKWRLGNAPVSNMTRLLESHGILVATIKTGQSETDACSTFVNKRPFIFLDTHKECLVRTRFNLAHELGHLILHNEVSQADLEDKTILNRVEAEANLFASCFLLPHVPFLLDITSTSLMSFLPLKLKWKVSIQAMIHRCKDLNVFSESQLLYLYKQISTKKWRQSEPYDNEWPVESIAILPTAIKMLVDRGDYTKSELLDIFRFSGSDIEEFCSLPKGYFCVDTPENAKLVEFINKKTYKD